MSGLTYRDAGVDIDAGDRLVERIKPLAARTRIPEVLTGVGGFAGLCSVPADIEDPVLVSGTDGVGTKLKLAFQMGVHDSVGLDLVAMCVNDVITTGARPLFFLDYFAVGKLDVDVGADVVKGIARGCEEAGCALLGGETAELPGFYAEGEYDLAGFAVGVVSRRAIVEGSAVGVGDRVIGVASSGLHSNGYSLARKALLERAGLRLDERVDSLGDTVGQTLLRPTRIYAKAVRAALDTGGVHGLCHVTGGGLPGNLPRILGDGLGIDLRPDEWTRPAVFDLIERAGEVTEEEMRRTFNLGIGFVVLADASASDAVVAALGDAGETAWDIGEVVQRTAGEDPVVRFD
ncbi:MAG: phosphoribosylformylglycinamidine cyclo-ligase [Myxococcota bacterium]